MTWSAGILRVAICLTLLLCWALSLCSGWAAGLYLPPSPSYRYITLSAPLFPTSHEACEELQQEFSDIQRELSAQHEQCLRDAPDQEHGDDGGTCSKSSCQALHTARDQAGKYAQQEVSLCRQRLNDYLAEKRRKEERARRDAEEAESDRRDRERRDQERERDRQHAEQQEKLDRERQSAKEKADRERRDQEDRAHRDVFDRAEQSRQQAEALRQAHFHAVTQTATQLKDTWTDRIRNGLPEVASGLMELMQVTRGVARGDGSYKLVDLVVAADTLLERSKSASKWITSPLQSSVDQVMGDAIDMVRAERAYQRSDARLQTIFRGIKSVNELAHDTNPFTKALSGAALDQIDHHVKTILGELEQLEAEVGSFDYSKDNRRDQPIANPFKGTPSKRTASTVETENPFRSSPANRPREQEAGPEPVVSPSAGERNPFRSGGETGTPVIPQPLRPNPTQSTKQPPATVPGDPLVRYRDPTTGQLSTRRRSTLPTSAVGDDPDGTRCSPNGLGIVTDRCEKLRRAGVNSGNKAVR